MGSYWSQCCQARCDVNDCENVHRIDTIQKWEEKMSEANGDGKIIVLSFFASWCSPSKSIAPVYCHLADKYTSMIFLSVDIDEFREFSSSWDVKSTPSFFFLKDGECVDKLVGAEKAELQKKTAAVVNLANAPTEI